MSSALVFAARILHMGDFAGKTSRRERAAASANGKSVRGSKLEIFLNACTVPFEEGIVKAQDEHRVIASNKRLSGLLLGANTCNKVRNAFPCGSGTMTAFVEPGKSFKEQGVWSKTFGAYLLTYTDPRTGSRWFFPVPREYEDEKNAILVAEHPDYVLELDRLKQSRTVHLVDARLVDLLRSFPAQDGWYLGDPKHDIPIGRQLEQLKNSGNYPERARYLMRTAKKIGTSTRYLRTPKSSFKEEEKKVGLFVHPSSPLGLLVETNGPSAEPEIEPEQKLAIMMNSSRRFTLRGPVEKINSVTSLLRDLSVVGNRELLTLTRNDTELVVEGEPRQIALASELLETFGVDCAETVVVTR